MVAVLPTRYGKSLVFHVLLRLLNRERDVIRSTSTSERGLAVLFSDSSRLVPLAGLFSPDLRIFFALYPKLEPVNSPDVCHI